MKQAFRNIIKSFLFLSPFIGMSQELPEVIPSNPEASAFMKYIDTPVGVETGIPNVSVPLVELKGRKLNIPVSLSYHAGGIRVNEVASRVGLGWNLNAGGAISRAVRGIPDDYSTGYLSPTVTVDQFLSASEHQKNSWLVLYGNSNDYESDIYSFNFLGQSGKFFFKQDGTIVMIHKKDVKIESKFEGNTIKGWVITDANGTKYYFGKSKDNSTEVVERTTTQSLAFGSVPQTSASMSNYINNWQLIEIETLDNEKVTFNYSIASNTEYYSLASQEKEINTGSGTSNNSERLFYTISQDVIRRLTSISNSLGRVDFIYDTAVRQDLNMDYALKDVKLFDNHNNLVDSYSLAHSYFISTNHITNPTIGDYDQQRKRLYLQDVKQTINAVTNKEWSFEYNTQFILPNRISFAQDFWGFYNGANNGFYYPSIQWPVNGVLYTIAGADREVSEVYNKACTLKKITYPTKGSTEFVYESNRVNNLPFFGTTEMTNQTIDNLSSIGMPDGTYEKTITINNLDDYPGGISWYANLTNNCSNSNGFDCPKAELLKYDGSQYVVISETSGMDLQQGIVTSGNSIQLKIKIYDYSASNSNDIQVSISGIAFPPDSGSGSYTGGLRVKKVTTRDYDNNVVLEKDYLYTQFSDPSASSGAVLNPPTFVYKNTPICQGPGGSTSGYSDVLKANSIYPLTGGSSYTTFYTSVTELFDNGNNGKIEYTKSFFYDTQQVQNNIFNEGVNTPALDFSHRRGLQTLKRTFAKENSIFKIKEEVQTVYSPGGTFSANNIAVALGGNCYNYYNEYNNRGEHYYKTEETMKTYDNNNFLSDTVIYKYDSGFDGRAFPIETEKTTSDSNLKIITKTFFPDDVSATNSLGLDNLTTQEKDAILKLKKTGLHQVAIPLQVETTTIDNSATVLSKIVQRTNLIDTGNDIVLPKDLKTLKGIYSASSNNLEARIVYHSYYSNTGNLKQISKKDGTNIIYIWGYNENLPIAKIENTTYSQVQSLVSSLQTKSNNDDDRTIGSIGNEGLLRTELNNLRDVLPNAMVSTYTYDPQIGVTSITDYKGYTTYYEYDAFNRLKRVKDADGNILSENTYHYKDQ